MASKRVSRYVFNKETMTFPKGSLDHIIHKQISAIRLGETMVIEGNFADKDEKEAYNKAIHKSAYYNNIDINVTWAKDNKSVKVTSLL